MAKIDLPFYQIAVTHTNLFSPQSDAHFTPTPLPQKIIMFSATTAHTTFITSIVALRPTTKTTSKRAATSVVRFIILFAFLFLLVLINHLSYVEDSDIDKLVKHFKGLSIDQPLSWYANIDLNFKLSAEWRKQVKTPVSFIFGEIDDAVKLNEKMFERLSKSGTNVTITEITGAGHWLPITHKESVLKEIYA